MKRVLVLALALTLCLGLAATVFAALPSYDVIASRIGVSSSLNENDAGSVSEYRKKHQDDI